MKGTREQPRKSRLTLRLAVTVPFVLLMVAVMGLVGYLTLTTGRQSVTHMAARLQRETGERIRQSLQDHLSLPHMVNRLSASSEALGPDSDLDFDRLRHSFLDRLQVFPQVTTAGVGTMEGEFLAVGRRVDGTYDTAVLDRSLSSEYRHYLLDEHAQPSELLTVVSDYDPRTRSWFKAALDAGRATWSPIYVWASHRNIGLSAVLPAYGPAGEPAGVYLSALSLGHISQFLGALSEGHVGQAFIMEPAGYLVAASGAQEAIRDRADGSGMERVLAWESDDSVVRAAAEHIQTYYGAEDHVVDDRHGFELDRQWHYMRVMPFADPYGLDWLIVTVVSESEVMGPIEAGTRNAVYFSLLALALAVAIGLLIGRWVTRPILELNESARRLADGQWDRPLPIRHAGEVGELTRSFNRMAGQLRATMSTLEERVAQRTAVLAETNRRLKQEVAERRLVAARFARAQQVGRVGSWEYNVVTTEFWGSDEAKRIYGFEPEDVTFSTEEVESRIPERARVHQALVDLIERGAPYDIEFEVCPKGAVEKTTISSVAELVRDENGQPVRVVGVIQDITARKRAEQEILRLNAALEQRVVERTEELREAQEQLVRRERLAMLGQLAGSVGHELRNPLGVIHNAVYFLQHQLGVEDGETQEYLDIIGAQVEKSAKIVSDLLSLSRAPDDIPVQRVRVSVAALIERTLSELTVPEGVVVSVQAEKDLPLLFVDAQQIGQVLANLITNAYQAMPEGGQIEVGAAAAEAGIEVSVRDAGSGMTPEQLEHLFEPLYTTKARGIGLGLALSKRLVEANGGRITVHSVPGEGSTFALWLPLVPPGDDGQSERG